MTTILLSFLLAQTPAPAVPLWEGKAPYALNDTEVPKLHVYLAAKPNGSAAVVCPGGGYGHLAMDHEGKQVAEFLNNLGIHAFVLEYRIVSKAHPAPLHPAPMEDAQRAIRLVRFWKDKHGIDPKRVGIVGFSAGGHLASTAGTHFDGGKPNGDGKVDNVSCRPDFLVLGYPVISFEDGVTHGGSRKNLIGDKPDAKLIEYYSNDKQVTAETPPTFIFQTHEDTAVIPENAIRFYLALKKAKVPAELHLYEKGKHGVGMNPKTNTPTDQWGQRLAEWLKTREIAK